MTPGFATADGTARFSSRFPAQIAAGFYRQAAGLTVSSLGLGTYLGGLDDQTDRGYSEAVLASVRAGINFLDTAINYRHQRSERSVGAALRQLFNADELQRDELVVCTKAGFLTPGAVPSLQPEQIAGGVHSMDPAFLADQIDRSRENLGLDTVDIFYLHNTETQLGFVPREEFDARIRAAFHRLEQLVSDHKISFYGTATWEGYRKQPESSDALSLTRMVELANEAGGEEHHFRFIQLPFNLQMVEAFTQRGEQMEGERLSVLDAARRSGIAVVASATLMQSRLASNLPGAIAERLPGLNSDAQRAIQFTRSTPGIAVALVGMSNPIHVAENMSISSSQPATREQYLRLFHSDD